MREDAHFGALAADALAMPAHWYYDRDALLRDYGEIRHFMAPKNPHPDSILYRSEFTPAGPEAEILHDQAVFWGQRGIHYHQFLKAGENTVNFQLARTLFTQIQQHGGYCPERWLDTYIKAMQTPGWHRDTYLEEYHRAFFNRLAMGKKPHKCGIKDEHIGGLAHVAALFSALPELPLEELRQVVKTHVSLTHRHSNVLRAADCLLRLLHRVHEGEAIREAIAWAAGDWFSSKKAERYLERPDHEVIGPIWSPACYIDQAFPAAIYLVYKYHDNFEAGIVANTMVGGDNCHRGVLVGSLLGLATGLPQNFASIKSSANPETTGNP